jgi:MTH538 TIR-like domain (DUF1863)
MRTPNIFISHRWAYKEDYYDLVNLLNRKLLKYYDYSVPEHDPFDLYRVRQIEAQLKEQVRQCNFFIVSARMASINSRWIEKEVRYANEYGKYILSVIPTGYYGNIPLFIQECETERLYLSDGAKIIRRIENHLS